MSDEIPKFELRMREGATGLMTGANTELLMNGKRMGTVTKVKVEVEARGMAKMTLEMFGQFKVVGNFEPEVVERSLVEAADDQKEVIRRLEAESDQSQE